MEDNQKRKEIGRFGVLSILAGCHDNPAKVKKEFAGIKSSSLKNPALYYLTTSTAIVLTCKSGTGPYPYWSGFYIYVGKIGSSWKVLAFDDHIHFNSTLSIDQIQLIEQTLMKRATETN